MSTSRSLSFFRDRVSGCPQQSQNSNPLNRFSLPIRAGQRCSARIFTLPMWTDRPSGMKQPPEKSAQYPKLVHLICHTDADFLLAIEPEMCYNIPAKATVATAPPEKPGSTTSRADITIPPSADSSMRIPLLLRGRDSLATICLRIVTIIQFLLLTASEKVQQPHNGGLDQCGGYAELILFYLLVNLFMQ